MSIRPWKSRVALVVSTLTALTFVPAIAARADWLVTRDGQPIETQGGWKVCVRQVIFTLPTGTLSSLRLQDVDFDASAAVTEEARQQAAASQGEETAEEPAREPVVRPTDRDDARGTALRGLEVLVDCFRTAHRYGNLDVATGLVFWQDVPEPLRQVVRQDFAAMMGRQLVEVRIVPLTSEEARILPEVDGVVYEPNLPLTHRLELHFETDAPAAGEPGSADTGDAPAAITNLYVGQRLGTYRIAGPVEGFKVIVNPGNTSISKLSKKQVSDYLLKKDSKWRNGIAVDPVDLDSESLVREVFSRKVHGHPTLSIKRFWQQLIFSGRSVPPPEVTNDAAVVAYVASNPGAIGYVSLRARLDGVKVVDIDDIDD